MTLGAILCCCEEVGDCLAVIGQIVPREVQIENLIDAFPDNPSFPYPNTMINSNNVDTIILDPIAVQLVNSQHVIDTPGFLDPCTAFKLITYSCPGCITNPALIINIVLVAEFELGPPQRYRWQVGLTIEETFSAPLPRRYQANWISGWGPAALGPAQRTDFTLDAELNFGTTGQFFDGSQAQITVRSV